MPLRVWPGRKGQASARVWAPPLRTGRERFAGHLESGRGLQALDRRKPAQEFHFPEEAGKPRPERRRYTAREVVHAWSPFALIAVFVIAWGVPAVKALITQTSVKMPVPGLHQMVLRTAPVVEKDVLDTAVFSFDWLASDRFPTLSRPYEGYLGVTYAETFGPAAFAARARTEGLRDFGACLSPHNAFYILQGIETLSLRMARHVANTERVLAFLKSHPAVSYLVHPSLPDHPDHALAQRLLPRGAGSIVSFGVKGGRAAGARFIEACRLASHLANVGDAKTLVIHPASTTHRQLSKEELEKAGVSEDMIRLSVGIEHVDDLIADLDQALAAA